MSYKCGYSDTMNKAGGSPIYYKDPKKEVVKDSVPAYDPNKDPEKDPYYLKAQKKYDSLYKKNPKLAESFRIKKNSKNKKGEYEMYIAPNKN